LEQAVKAAAFWWSGAGKIGSMKKVWRLGEKETRSMKKVWLLGERKKLGLVEKIIAFLIGLS